MKQLSKSKYYSVLSAYSLIKISNLTFSRKKKKGKSSKGRNTKMKLGFC